MVEKKYKVKEGHVTKLDKGVSTFLKLNPKFKGMTNKKLNYIYKNK